MVSSVPVGTEEDGNVMKNTGKRIFYAIAFVTLVNLPVLVMAGAAATER